MGWLPCTLPCHPVLGWTDSSITGWGVRTAQPLPMGESTAGAQSKDQPTVFSASQAVPNLESQVDTWPMCCPPAPAGSRHAQDGCKSTKKSLVGERALRPREARRQSPSQPRCSWPRKFTSTCSTCSTHKPRGLAQKTAD